MSNNFCFYSVNGKNTEKFEVSPIDEQQMDIVIARCEDAHNNSRYLPGDRKKRFGTFPGITASKILI